jgi:hypothetical protein
MRELAAILARIDISVAQSRIPDPADVPFIVSRCSYVLLIRVEYPETEVPFSCGAESMNCAILLFYSREALKPIGEHVRSRV